MAANNNLESEGHALALNESGEAYTYSSRVLRNLAKNPLFKPKRGKDGRPSATEMLAVASTLLSAADERIATLEKRAFVLNAPIFQSPTAYSIPRPPAHLRDTVGGGRSRSSHDSTAVGTQYDCDDDSLRALIRRC